VVVSFDVHERIVAHGLPVENAGHLPDRVTGTVPGDLHDGGDQFMIPDAAIIRACDGAKLDASIVRFQRLHKLGAVGKQAVLQVDACECGGELPHVGRGRADEAAQLAERHLLRAHLSPPRERCLGSRALPHLNAMRRDGSPPTQGADVRRTMKRVLSHLAMAAEREPLRTMPPFATGPYLAKCSPLAMRLFGDAARVFEMTSGRAPGAPLEIFAISTEKPEPHGGSGSHLFSRYVKCLAVHGFSPLIARVGIEVFGLEGAFLMLVGFRPQEGREPAGPGEKRLGRLRHRLLLHPGEAASSLTASRTAARICALVTRPK